MQVFATRGGNDYKVKALVRRPPNEPFPVGVETVIGEVTQPETLRGIMADGVDIVVSAVGITRQRDGVTYEDVDYMANVNLLVEAEQQGQVKRFAYIHVIHGEELAKTAVAVAAKQAFVDRLKRSTIASTVVCPTGFFSDMRDFLDMAKGGRVYLFGNGEFRLNPIHGEDLAMATANAIETGRDELSVGGPDTFTHKELATMALEVSGKPAQRITYLWDSIRRFLLCSLPWVTPISVYGPAQFFLEAMGRDTVGETTGTHHLRDYWVNIVEEESSK